MRKDICVQHWVSSREAQYTCVLDLDHIRELTVRISNFG
jgi:hypothetical protein